MVLYLMKFLRHGLLERFSPSTDVLIDPDTVRTTVTADGGAVERQNWVFFGCVTVCTGGTRLNASGIDCNFQESKKAPGLGIAEWEYSNLLQSDYIVVRDSYSLVAYLVCPIQVGQKKIAP